MTPVPHNYYAAKAIEALAADQPEPQIKRFDDGSWPPVAEQYERTHGPSTVPEVVEQ